MINVAAYIYPSALKTPTGVSMLALNMVRVLARNPEVKLWLLAPAAELGRYGRMPAELGLDRIPVIPLTWKRSLREGVWLTINAPVIDNHLPHDCRIYCPRETFIPTRRCKRVVTVHHLEPQKRRSGLGIGRLAQCRGDLRLKKAITTADLVIAQSTFTKAQIIDRFGVPRERIKVVGSGVSEEILDIGASNWSPAQVGYEPYVVSPGPFEFRKGTDYLLAMARELTRRKVPLNVVCPSAAGGAIHLLREAAGMANVVVLDYVSRENLLQYLRNAVCAVIPSRLEGFGLAAVESMAMGTPVVASNNSALPETLGGAGVLVDPSSAVLMADAVERIFRDPKFRSALSSESLKRARHFSWTRCMERLLCAMRSGV